MTAALDIITGAAKLIGVAYKSEALSADEAADGLVSLNDMLGEWSNDSLLIYSPTLEVFSLVSGTASYTIGSGQTFNTTRPITIKNAFVRLSSVDYPLTIISTVEYNAIPVKATSGPPEYLVYNNAYPAGTIKLYPTPTGGSLYIESNKPFTSFAALTTTVDLPPGWNKALRYNLALEMAPEYGVEPAALAIIVEQAKRSKGALKRSTSANIPMPLLSEFGGFVSILSGAD